MSEPEMNESMMPEQVHKDQTVLFGFWVYLMTDCVLFASLFATYGVLHSGTFGNVTSKQIFELPFALAETLILLTSSFVCGLGVLALKRGNKKYVLLALGLTFLLGSLFIGLELSEFHHLISQSHSWQASGFLSAFFALVGTHGLHITIGLLWLVALVTTILKKGLTSSTSRRLVMFSLFWHFLDVIWIFIFTTVYLMGVL